MRSTKANCYCLHWALVTTNNDLPFTKAGVAPSWCRERWKHRLPLETSQANSRDSEIPAGTRPSAPDCRLTLVLKAHGHVRAPAPWAAGLPWRGGSSRGPSTHPHACAGPPQPSGAVVTALSQTESVSHLRVLCTPTSAWARCLTGCHGHRRPAQVSVMPLSPEASLGRWTQVCAGVCRCHGPG